MLDIEKLRQVEKQASKNRGHAEENVTALQNQMKDKETDKVRHSRQPAVYFRKLKAKLVEAQDKLVGATGIHLGTEHAVTERYNRFTIDTLPVLQEKLRKIEEHRLKVLLQGLGQCADVHQAHISSGGDVVSVLLNKVFQLKIEDDLRRFGDEFINAVESSDVPAKSLINPEKQGMLCIRGIDEWKERICILKEATLYIYDSETAIRPKAAIYLPNHGIYPLDNSFFASPYCFQIISSTGKGFYFCCESFASYQQWMLILKRTTYCCDRDYLLAARRITAGRDVAQLRLRLGEAKDLASKGLKVFDPYCVVMFAKESAADAQGPAINFAKTPVQFDTRTPFWGEEYSIPYFISNWLE